MRVLVRIAVFLPIGVAAFGVYVVALVIETMRDLSPAAARMRAHSPEKRR